MPAMGKVTPVPSRAMAFVFEILAQGCLHHVWFLPKLLVGVRISALSAIGAHALCVSLAHLGLVEELGKVLSDFWLLILRISFVSSISTALTRRMVWLALMRRKIWMIP